MASAACVNIGVSPENFLDCPPATTSYPSYGWLSPRISFSRELPDDDPLGLSGDGANKPSEPPEALDPESSAADFEFRLEDPVAMLPADKLFSDGKLVPLQLTSVKPSSSVSEMATSSRVRSPETGKFRRRNEISGTDPYLFSPKAPRCSSRWRELLGLKRLYNTNPNPKTEPHKTTSSFSSNAPKSLKNFLHRSSKSSSSSSSSYSSLEASLSLPLLKDSSDCESVSLSSRLSLSSSSSGHEHDDLPRHSLDSDKPNTNPISLHRNPNNPPRMRMVKPRPVSVSSENLNAKPLIDHQTASTRVGRSRMRRSAGTAGGGGGESSSGVGSRGVSVDSPRMNSSGKIVFQSLERSSSSPSSFNGGPRFKHRGMERSYSANVRVTPVLNVPVCSLRGSSKSVSVFGFGQLFSSPQKRSDGNVSGGNGKTNCPGHGRSRSDRTRSKPNPTEPNQY
ncbi:serine/arginine repetitive matrix-like protein [Parasponia andersonii]|uniref:Serine/arginine repetitive matrix-like protein n=1 Tax=Parasponia andersonii TaxID=3476 RepID=A0A2P5D1Y5_PARAD|nr:serine/arginine repetitive matrix-like protein [Parasponia andersonii]